MLNVLYKGDQCGVELYPAWPMSSRNLTPSTQGISPPLLSAGHWRPSLLVALNKEDLDSVVDIRKQPNPEPVAVGECT